MFYFLREDLEDLDIRIAELRSWLENTAQSIGQSAGGEGAWHDNFAFEEAHRQHSMHTKRLEELQKIRDQAQLVDPEVSTEAIAIGKTVTIIDEETDEARSFQIGSYMILDKHRTAVSYAAPLAQLIYGARIGEVREGVIGGTLKRYKIIEIR
uniref:Transcription elongation factor GreA/GreB C-terminal domain-containing protein n=1 Tax=candidate division WWE3 bacterium TaxID=2053526 RepID=A0A831Z359_UNCKA